VNNQEIADRLLYPCWRGMSDAFKMRYARNIWGQFEDNIRSAAYTSSLARFFESLCRKLGISIRADDTRTVTGVLTSGEDRSILRALRDETTELALLVRLKNDERKDALKKERELDNDNSHLRGRDDSALFDLA
jgi:hypothetical protein